MSVRDVSSVTSLLELDLMSRYTSEEERTRIKQWKLCLVHEYSAPSGLDEIDHQSDILLRYVSAHLRLICPTKMIGQHLQGYFDESSRFHVLGFSAHHPPIVIEDCEFFFEVTHLNLQKLSAWIPWIVRFQKDWREYYPLFLSMYLFEKSYLEEDRRVRHLLRVMALEALFDSETEFGAAILASRLKAFLGRDTDIYTQYGNGMHTLPKLPLRSVVPEVCDLRNKVAHGIPVPDTFKKARTYQNQSRGGSSYHLTHEDVLREAATSMVSLSWQRILNEQLQETFADKTKMRAFFQQNTRTR